MERPQKIAFREMRESGVRGVLIYCSDYKCSHHTAISADQWPDNVRLTDLESLFVVHGMRQERGRRAARLSLAFEAPRRL
jgi:hypothetical protein